MTLPSQAYHPAVRLENLHKQCNASPAVRDACLHVKADL